MKLSRRLKVYLPISLAFLSIACILNYHYKLCAINFHIKEPTDEPTFSIITFNVDAVDSTAFTEEKQKGLLELIRKERPDILCMHELSFESLKRIKPQLDSIYGTCDTLKGDNQLWRLRLYSAFPLRNFIRHKCIGAFKEQGLELTEENLQEIKQFQKQMNVMSAEFEVTPGNWVTVFSGHLRSSAYTTARRSMDEDSNWFDGLSLYWRNYQVGKSIRDYEAENVRRLIDEGRSLISSENTPVIVAGDMNDWCGSYCLETLMDKDLKDAWWEGGNCFGWTYFGWNLRLRLDHILYSDELELVDVEVVDNTDISDHKPLMAKFRLK